MQSQNTSQKSAAREARHEVILKNRPLEEMEKWADDQRSVINPNRKIKSLRERFYSFVDKSELGCWNWTGSLSGGYGQFGVGYKPMRASHVALMMDGVSIGKNQYVCHHCDNPKCVRPAHLFLGTQLENIRDAIEKKRMLRNGQDNPTSKLTDVQVLEIRARSKECNRRLAKEFGVTPGAVCMIVHRKRWAHLSATPEIRAEIETILA